MDILYILAILAIIGAIYYLAPSNVKHTASHAGGKCTGDVCYA